ncbi:hypothetical protein [Methylobacter sp.]|uniref:hypothetical protein n=1 Tax=Methylobacter sp. TaxID=2051955 RepID=UPI0011F825C1|nr:hypothetical protein [Methylobacter sp.]TAK59557.1 MAG: hypothetical protein EPO18_20560 [Methylobacter sp.]
MTYFSKSIEARAALENAFTVVSSLTERGVDVSGQVKALSRFCSTYAKLEGVYTERIAALEAELESHPEDSIEREEVSTELEGVRSLAADLEEQAKFVKKAWKAPAELGMAEVKKIYAEASDQGDDEEIESFECSKCHDRERVGLMTPDMVAGKTPKLCEACQEGGNQRWFDTELICPGCDLSAQEKEFGLTEEAKTGEPTMLTCPGCGRQHKVRWDSGMNEWDFDFSEQKRASANKRWRLDVLDPETKSYVDKKEFATKEDAEAEAEKLRSEAPLTFEYQITDLEAGADNTEKPDYKTTDGKELEKADDEAPKAKIVKSWLRVSKDKEHEWKIESAKLRCPIYAATVVEAAEYLVRLSKRLDYEAAACMMEHANAAGSFAVLADMTWEMGVGDIQPHDDSETCPSCGFHKSIDVAAPYDFTTDESDTGCPGCGWKAEPSEQGTSAIMDPLGAQPMIDTNQMPSAGPHESVYSHRVEAKDEAGKKREKAAKSLSPEKKAKIEGELRTAAAIVSQSLIAKEAIRRELRNYEAELKEALGLAGLQDKAALVEDKVKALLNTLDEQEKIVGGIEFKLRNAHERVTAANAEQLETVMKDIQKIIKKGSEKQFDKLHKQLYVISEVAESFSASIPKEGPGVPEVREEIEEKTEELAGDRKGSYRYASDESTAKKFAGEVKKFWAKIKDFAMSVAKPALSWMEVYLSELKDVDAELDDALAAGGEAE